MATSTRLSLLEYMKTSYRPDREFVDGELRERNVGKWEHARLQALLASWFQSQEKSWSVKGSHGAKSTGFSYPCPHSRRHAGAARSSTGSSHRCARVHRRNPFTG